jgi:hypothetical protein
MVENVRRAGRPPAPPPGMNARENKLDCEYCGAPVTAAAGGLCPRCLLRAGLTGLRAEVSSADFTPEFRLLGKIGEGGMGEV